MRIFNVRSKTDKWPAYSLPHSTENYKIYERRKAKQKTVQHKTSEIQLERPVKSFRFMVGVSRLWWKEFVEQAELLAWNRRAKE